MNGYILKSKSILESDIWKKPPLYYKVFDYLCVRAEFKDTGKLKRGQLFVTIAELQDQMTYFVGYRKIVPTVKQIRSVLDWLRNPYEGPTKGTTKGPMIVTTKVTHGMLVTVCNYNKYQDPRYYEGHDEGHNESPAKVLRRASEGHNIMNEYKNKNNEEDSKRDIERRNLADDETYVNDVRQYDYDESESLVQAAHEQFAQFKRALMGARANDL